MKNPDILNSFLIVSENPFKLKYYHDRYKTQEMCNKAVDDFLSALKFVLDCLVPSKIIKKLLTQMIIYSIYLRFW